MTGRSRATRKRKLSLHTELWSVRTPFRISGKTWEQVHLAVCEIEEDGRVGRGEGAGVYYLDDEPAAMSRQIAAAADHIESGISREQLLDVLPAGGARNAVDCALWDLEAQHAERSVWNLVGIEEGPIDTTMTVGLESDPAAMAEKAAAACEFRIIKVKLDGDRPVERVHAIREARPDARLIVDVNQAWDLGQLQRFAPALRDLGVVFIEQPLPRGRDAELAGYTSPLPLCADESCLDSRELWWVDGRYQMINIKLDKCGGLTSALALAADARRRGLGLMVGNMLCTSLGIGPAHIIARLADFADLDGPLLLTYDRPQGMRYEGGQVLPQQGRFWGTGQPR
jgi:L-alanine-DL-glutamate epimerase-like enolase superfamily enzyme